MIRATKSSLKFANANKQLILAEFIDEYTSVVRQFVDICWELESVPALLPKTITAQVTSWLSARAIQCAGKQASGVVRGTKQKQKQRAWRVAKLITDGEIKKAEKLQRLINKTIITKPIIDQLEPELDSRFVKISLSNETSFDGWVNFSSLGRKIKLSLPFKKTKHFNKMLINGALKSGIRISTKSVTFMIDREIAQQDGTILGIDIGLNNTISCSNGFSSTKNQHGHDLSTIIQKLSKKKKGGVGFRKAQTHRTNFINWSINQLNLSDIAQINLENIKDIRRNKTASRTMSHWAYPCIRGKLERYAEEHGVRVLLVNPTYTSQRCSNCGWTCSSNRKAKLFVCQSCDFSHDSDLNAANNIATALTPIYFGGMQQLNRDNKTGFYWNEEVAEPIVPLVQKNKMSCFI